MCSFGSNQSAPTTQYSTQTTTADPRAAQMYSAAWQKAQQTAQRPFNPYSYDPNAFVAPMNSTQLTAVNNIYGQQNAGQPFYQQAGQMAYNAGNTSSAGLAGAYMSPYLNSVAASTMGILGQQQAQDRNRLSGQIASNGQWGNDRSGIERATLAGQQNLASANTISNLYNQGYNTALGAAQTDLNRQLQASGSLAGQGLQGAQSLLQAGTLGQQTQQAGLQALYNQYLMQQQYPFQVAQFLSSTAAGLGPGYGGTTSGYQSSQQPLSFFGNPLSDPALKVGPEGGEKPEVIGQTNDGQDIYRYRLVDPDTGHLGPVQIGLMADEVEQRRPDAIGDYKGFRTVDYAKATDDAARLGGGVMGRGDYADGGGIDDLLRSHEAMYAGLGKMPGGIVPQSQMTPARLDAPTLKFGEPQKKESYGIGQAAKDALGLIESGKGLYKEGKGVYDWLSTPSTSGGIDPDKVDYTQIGKYAPGGSVYDDTPEMTQGPTATQMPTAKLNAPELSFGSSGQNKQGTGIGDIVKGAAGLAGAAKTLWEIGSTVGPAVMAMSDRRLKTGVRPGYATEGGVEPDEDFLSRLFNQESGGKQFDKDGNPLTSSKGAVGIAQIMPGTMPEAARYAGVKPSIERLRSDPDYNKTLGRAYLKHQMDHFGGDREMALGAYNAGPSRVERAVAKANINGGDWKDYLPHETQAYIPAIMGKGLGRAMAYAGSEGAPKNAGIEAINAATKPGGVVPDDTAPAQGLSGFLRGAPASGLGEKALDFATSERFLIPLLTGLGTMASSGSRYLAPAVLQGLGAGAKSYLETPQVQAETELKKAEAANKRALTPKFALEGKKLETEMYDRQFVPNVGWMVYDKTKPYSPPVQITDANGKPLPGAESYGVATPGQPTSGAPEKPTSPSSPAFAGALDWKSTSVAPEGITIPGAYNSAMSGDIKNQQETAQKEIEEQGRRARAAYDQLYRLNEMEHQFDTLTKDGGFLIPGTNSDIRREVAMAANTLSAAIGGNPIFDPKDVAASEDLFKNATRLGFATAQGLGHEPGFIVTQAIKANPSAENSPMGFKRIVAGLKEAANYEQDRLQFMESYRQRYGTLVGAETLFKKLNPPDAYANRAILSTIPKADIDALRNLKPEQVRKLEKRIDDKYGYGVTKILLGDK